MPESASNTVILRDLPGHIKVLETKTFTNRLLESGIANYYLFRIRSKQKVIDAGKGVKPLTEEGRTALSISTETAETRIRKNIGNYGCYAFPDGLCFLDLDLDPQNPGNTVVPPDEILNLIENINTFTVITRSGGYQLYFKNPGLTENPHVYYVPGNHKEGEPLLDAGELRCNRQYVVCPGSYVPPGGPKGTTPDATGVYRVVWDVPIRTLDLTKFPPWLKTHDPVKDAVKYASEHDAPTVDINTGRPILEQDDISIKNSRGIPLSILRRKDAMLDDLLKGADHIGKFRSASEADESTIFRLLKTEFTDQQVYDIVIAYRWREKLLREDYLINSISHAKAKIYQNEMQVNTRGVTSIMRVGLPDLPQALPSNKISQIRASPRAGKTHRTMEWAIDSGSATYVSATHEVVENALNIFEKIVNSKNDSYIKNKTAVHITGKERACNEPDLHGNCSMCYKFPRGNLMPGETGVTFLKLQEEARELLKEKKILTPDRIPHHMCPYYTLHLAEKVADYCFTIPYFLPLDDPIKGVTERNLLIIDEDTTTRSFYPQCVKIAEEYHVKNQYTLNNILSREIMEFIEKIEKQITSSTTTRTPATNKIILHIVEELKVINTLLTSGINNPSQENMNLVHESLKNLPPRKKYDEDMAKKVLNKINDLALEMHFSHTNAAQIFEPFLYPAEPFLSWQGGRSRPMSLFAIAERTLLYVPKFKKLVVIGATESEMFLDDLVKKMNLADKNEVKIFFINNFKYSKNYVFFEIFRPDDRGKPTKYQEALEDEELEEEPESEVDSSSKYIRTLINIFSQDNRRKTMRVPCLLLTSTIEAQTRINSWLGGGSINCTDHDISEILKNWETGRINIFYQNSIISRGLDIPHYHSTFVSSCRFATPYWTSLLNSLEEQVLTPVAEGTSIVEEQKKYDELKKKIEEIQHIMTSIQMDETTNSVLRTAPIPGRFEDHVKMVFYTEHHKKMVSGAKYPGIATIPLPTTASIESIIAIIRALVDPVECDPGGQYLQYTTPRKFQPSTVEEAKALISNYMTHYHEISEARNLPVELVGKTVIFLLKANPKQRFSQEALIARCISRTKSRVNRSTIRKVLARLSQGRILVSEMSTGVKSQKMYTLHEHILTLFEDGDEAGWERVNKILVNI